MTTLSQIIGPMLKPSRRVANFGSVEFWFEGTLDHVEKFWQRRGQDWRVERSDGVTNISTPEGSLVTVGDRVERGPSLDLQTVMAATMLFPAMALIWGRPGEDWSMTDEVEDLADDLVRVPLRHESNRNLGAYLELDTQFYWLTRLVFPWQELRLTEVERGLGGRAEENLFALH